MERMIIGDYDLTQRSQETLLKGDFAEGGQFKIVVTTKSTNLIRELKNYRWKMDKDGNSLNEPIDNYNHGLDAVRYVLLNKLMYNRKRIHKVRSISV